MDAWCVRHRGQGYDRDAAFARSGKVDAALLERLLAEPWFALPPPKSTGRDLFHAAWLDARLARAQWRGRAEDLQATLAQLALLHQGGQRNRLVVLSDRAQIRIGLSQ